MIAIYVLMGNHSTLRSIYLRDTRDLDLDIIIIIALICYDLSFNYYNVGAFEWI